MLQKDTAHGTTQSDQDQNQEHQGNLLGPLLCWAVVFADIGTSVYYVPGILYQTVQGLAGFFVFLTMSVFVLLTLKYTEVTHRFPQGGGVVTVAAQALNPWFGALGGMFILVDYFLTAAISCLSGILYVSVIFPAITPYVLWMTIGILILLGLLNWVGVSESARVSLVGAVVAFASDVAILITVFTHISFGSFLALIPKMFTGHTLTFSALLVGFAGSFLAFSGLESISQLSPVMKQPHKKVAGLAMLMVILTVGLTSPLLTMLSTLLLPGAAGNDIQSAQIISLLGGLYGGPILQTEIAISAGALLVFASNTAIIGAYHVFMALSKMEFLPSVILQRNKLRNTPHFSIALATLIPILILIAVLGNINVLGDMYAFGLLGAFSLTCVGLDIVRIREWRRSRAEQANAGTQIHLPHDEESQGTSYEEREGLAPLNIQAEAKNPTSNGHTSEALPAKGPGLWFQINVILGIITTVLVITAWSTNLVTKLLATAFGGSVTLLGMGIAYLNYTRQHKKDTILVTKVLTNLDYRIPNSATAILTTTQHQNEAVIQAAIHSAEEDKPLVFLYLSTRPPRETAPQLMEIIDPYLDDAQARVYFGLAESLAVKAQLPRPTYIYLWRPQATMEQVWRTIRPYDTIVSTEDDELFKDINPDRIRYEITPNGRVAHLIKYW